MNKTFSFKEKISDYFIKSYSLIDRFVKLPVYAKIIITPLAFVLFFSLLFPIIIVGGIIYKIWSAFSDLVKEIIKNRRILLTVFKYFIFKIPIVIIITFILLFIVTLYIKITIPLLSVFILKLIGIILFPYLILTQMMFGNNSRKELKKTIKSINIGEFDIEGLIENLRNESGDKSSKNPLVWLLKSPFLLSIVSTLTFIGSILCVIIACATLNAAFPNLFFNRLLESHNQLHFWLRYIFDQLLVIIPVDFINPFLPNKTGVFVIQPWGNFLSIIFQIFLAYMAYQYISTVILSAKLAVHKKKINKVQQKYQNENNSPS